MPVAKVSDRCRNLLAPTRRRPAERGTDQLGQLVEQGRGDRAHEGHTGSPVDQIAQMLDPRAMRTRAPDPAAGRGGRGGVR